MNSPGSAILAPSRHVVSIISDINAGFPWGVISAIFSPVYEDGAGKEVTSAESIIELSLDLIFEYVEKRGLKVFIPASFDSILIELGPLILIKAVPL